MDEQNKPQAPQEVVNVITPAGELVGLAPHQVQDALGAGYKMATQAHVDEYKAKMGLPGPMTSMETPAPTAPPTAQDPHALIDPALRAQREAETSQWLKEESPRLAASMAGFSAAAPFGAPLGPVGMGVAGTAGAIAAQVGAGAGLNVLQGKPALSTLKKDIVEPAIGGGVGILGGAAARVLSGAGARAFGREAVEAAKFARAAEVSSQEEAARMALKQGDLATAAKQLAAPVESKGLTPINPERLTPEQQAFITLTKQEAPRTFEEVTGLRFPEPGRPITVNLGKGNVTYASTAADLPTKGVGVLVNREGQKTFFKDGVMVGEEPTPDVQPPVSQPSFKESTDVGLAPEREIGSPKAYPENAVVLTAENANSLPNPPSVNKANNKKLKQELVELRIPFIQTKSKFKGVEENPFVVHVETAEQRNKINKLAEKYGQSSAMHIKDGQIEIHNLSGDDWGTMHKGERLMESPNATDDYTVFDGKKFQSIVDWGTKHQRMLYRLGTRENPDIVDPAFEGTSTPGKEALRPGRIPRSNFYEMTQAPEELVVSKNKHVHYVEAPENILDFNSPKGEEFFNKAQEIVEREDLFPDDVYSVAEKLAAQSGYAGIKNSAGHLPGHVALFHPSEVVKAHPINPKFLEKVGYGRSGRGGEGAAPQDVGQTPPVSQTPPDAPAFYHRSEQVINEKMGGKATPEQVRAILKDIKADEREWLGIDEFLAGKDKVSKQELLDHIAGNRLELKEIKKGESLSEEELARLKELKAMPFEEFKNNDAAQIEYQQLLDKIAHGISDAKFSEYQTPGGKNYREVLFQMPDKPLSKSETPTDQAKRLFGKDSFYDLTPPQQEKIIRLQEAQVPKESYRTWHWDEPNVLAHARMNERQTTTGDNVLHVEEVQSDWHQAGREKGYKEGSGPSVEALESLQNKLIEEKRNLASKLDAGPEYDKQHAALEQKISSITDQILAKLKGVPNAPLKKSWHEFVMKKMLREAAESGKDGLTWTTGETQYERYPAQGGHGERIKEGMKGFYDKILPDYMNKLGKKFGAKVEKRLVDTGEAEVGKDAVVYSKPKWESGSESPDRVFFVKEHSIPVSPEFKTQAEADAWLKTAREGKKEEVHFFKITPELKKLIMKKGLPMFAVGGMVGMPADYSPIMKENYKGKRRGIQHFADGGIALPSIDQVQQNFSELAQTPDVFASAPASQYAPPVQRPDRVINVISPSGELIGVKDSQIPEALATGYRLAQQADVARYKLEQRFGGLGQQVLTGAEGFAKGLVGPVATGAEEVFSQMGVPGISAEERRGRMEANPMLFGASEAAGFIAPMVATLGASAPARAGIAGASKFTQAGAIAGAEKALASSLGLKVEAGFVNQVVPEAIKGAFGAALYQGGDEISKAFNQDPNQTAQIAVTNIGMAGVLGGIFAGTLGAAAAGLKAAKAGVVDTITPAFVSEVDRPHMEAGNFEAIVKNSNVLNEKEKAGILASLGKKKANAPEIEAAAKSLGAPVLEGMVADNKLVQRAEDALINGAPTYSGIKRAQLYKDAWSVGAAATDAALGPGSNVTKAELGNQLKEALTARLKQQNQPIEALYSLVKEGQQVLPVEEGALKGLIAELGSMKELQLSPSAPESKIIKRVVEELANVKTVDDLKAYKSILSRSLPPTAPSGEKRIVGIISDKLKELEEGSVIRAAKEIGKTDFQTGAKINSLIEQRKAADAMYKGFITDVKTLSERLGKGRVYGLQDALHFINERLTPEEVATRLFSKKDSEFLKFFEGKFPEEMQSIRDFQKRELRDASLADDKSSLSPLRLFNNVNKLEPEVQAILFKPEELQKLRDAETYLRSFPKNFNPSGTATKSALLEAFEHPVGAAIANARDMGIEAFVKLVSQSGDIQNATKLGKATVRGWNNASKAAKNLFVAGREVLPANVVSIASHREKLAKLVDVYSQNPAKFMEMNDNNPVPEYAQAFSKTAVMAVQYLDSIKPRADKKAPLDSKMPISQIEKAKYDRQVALVQQPLLIMQHIQDGTITPQDVTTIKTVYPELYSKLQADVFHHMAEAVEKGTPIPYRLKLTLSVFLGQPLDSSLQPSAIMAAQPKPQQSQEPAPKMPGPKRGTANLNKAPTQFQTPEQAREAHTQKR